MSKIRYLVSLVLQALLSLADQQCYFPNGTQAGSSWDLLPCKSGTDTVNCCSHTDFCTSNGLCLDSNGDNRFTMQGCTDSSWDGCLQACDIANNDSSWPFKFVFPCEADSLTKAMSYCCGSSTCCASLSTSTYNLTVATNFWRPPGATSSSTSTSASTTGTAASSAGADSSDSSRKLGLGLGLGLGIPFVAAVLVALHLAYRFRKSRSRGKSLDSSQPSPRGEFPPTFDLDTVQRPVRSATANSATANSAAVHSSAVDSPTLNSELDNEQPKSELGGDTRRYELFTPS